jgi:hypothetical protein
VAMENESDRRSSRDGSRYIRMGLYFSVKVSSVKCQCGSIGLVVCSDLPVSEPPFILVRMQASRPIQRAFNRRILESEDQIAAHNACLSEFLMGYNFTKPMLVAIGVQPVCGQLCTQENRSMTATCIRPDK